MRILLVEDHKATAETLTRLLQTASDKVEVFIAGTLADGLKLSIELKADVTLLDLHLPDVKSWRETVAAIPQFHPPVVVVTDLEDPAVEVECYKAGAQNVFRKSLALKMISVLIAAVTSARMRSLAQGQRNA